MQASENQLNKARFWKKFLRLTRGRVPVMRTLEVILQEETDDSFKKTLSSILSDVEKGTSLQQALGKHPAEFSASILELIKTAEKCGAWDEILQEVTDGLEEGTFH